jgi:hypothetical protein
VTAARETPGIGGPGFAGQGEPGLP